MKTYGKLAFAAVFGLFLLVAGCGKQDPKDGSGTLSLNITDAPVDSSTVSKVMINVTGVEYNLNGTWKAFADFAGPKSYDLTSLTGGISAAVGDMTLEAGDYTQIRFLLDAPAENGNSAANPGSYVELADGTQEPLFVPSGAQTGYKATGNFAVPVNGTVTVTADFDLRKALVVTGKRYILKPVVRLVVDNQAGDIKGAVTNPPADGTVVIYAYTAGTQTAATVSADEAANEFANSVTSGKASATYTVAYLAAGSYDLVAAHYNADGTFNSVLGYTAGVSVASGADTTQDLDLSALSATLN